MITLAWMAIPLSRGLYALVDGEDCEWLSQCNWYAHKERSTYYATRHIQRNGKRSTITMHQQILCVPKGFETDHVNNNGLDNRKCNLRICTNAQNQANSKLTIIGASKYRGVKRQGKKWCAYIGKKGESLGLFINEIDAAKTYDKEAKKRYGEFARPNF